MMHVNDGISYKDSVHNILSTSWICRVLKKFKNFTCGWGNSGIDHTISWIINTIGSLLTDHHGAGP